METQIMVTKKGRANLSLAAQLIVKGAIRLAQKESLRYYTTAGRSCHSNPQLHDNKVSQP